MTTSMTVIRRLRGKDVGKPWYVRCDECGRIFDLFDDEDASEAAHGHDCHR